MHVASLSPSQSTGSPSHLRGWLSILLLVLVTAAAYSNSLQGEFILDDVLIAQNPTIRHLWPVWDVLAAPQAPGSTTQGRPMVTLSLAVNYAISGLDVWSYHLVNLLLHVLVALTLLGLLRRTLSLPAIPSRLQRSAGPLALAIALIWAVHPLTTAAVTYTVQRAEAMAALFYLLTLYAALRGSQAANGRSLIWYGCAIVACFAGMASKEVMVSAPLAVLLFDRALLAGSFRQALARRWGLYIGLAASWGLLAMLVLASGNRGGSAGTGVADPLAYAATEAGVVLHYLRLVFWPSPLCLDYQWPLAKSAGEVVPGALVLIVLLAATAWALWRRPQWGFLGAAFFLVLAPTSSFLPLADPAFEHRMYLPLAAVIAAVTIAAYGACVRWLGSAAGGRGWSAGRAAVVGMLVLTLAVATYSRNEDYRTGISIWRQTLAQRPDNQRAHHCLGYHLEQAGEFDQALREYNIAVRLAPKDPTIFPYRSRLYWRLGQRDSAIADVNRAIELEPANAANFLARAGYYFQMRRYDLAWKDLIECRRLGCEPPPANVAMLAAMAPPPPQWRQ